MALVVTQFPSPLGGSQFSKEDPERVRVVDDKGQFPSPLGGSQFSKWAFSSMAAYLAAYLRFHPLWAGLSFQSRLIPSP